MTKKPLKLLLLEDSDDDAALVLHELSRAYDVTFVRVETAEAMSVALDRGPWDIILSDYSMPQFSAPEAHRLLRQRGIDVPFIIVSGTVGEETAVAAMRDGVDDYLLKGNLTRLGPAIEREMRDSALRQERRRIQEQLLISDRMASIGTLAAGVAHEVNNPLAALMANLDLLSLDFGKLVDRARVEFGVTPDDPIGTGWLTWLSAQLAEICEPLDEARHAADRVRHIVRDLKMFSRSNDEERRGPVNLRAVLDSSIRMARTETRHRARVVKHYGDVPAVEGNEARLGQVFLNLVVNAAQAIPEGRAESNEIRVVTRLFDNEHVAVEISDTGSGIAPEMLTRIFDPFFSTKPIGVGTGLGLAICHRIVTSLGGELKLESEVGKGTTFRVVLPIAGSEPIEAKSKTPAVVKPGRRGHILVVDDEAMIATAVRRALGPYHDVEVTTDARVALDRVKDGQRFDVILCDLMMPEMTGMELHAEIEQVSPEQAALMIFMTGGAFTTNARAFLDRVPNGRIEKPFDVRDLQLLIAAMLK